MQTRDQAFVPTDRRPPTEPPPFDGMQPSGACAPGAKADRPVVNYFSAPTAAVRYAANRPQSHSRVLELVAEHLQGKLPVDQALDVGCGTGHSTLALVPYAKRIVGIDSSSEMLAQAPRHPLIDYRKGYAEALPFRAKSFDLLTVSAAYHWFDQERFLHEAARVLRPDGGLLLYKVGSMGRAVGQPSFENWRQETLRSRYPKVARNNDALTRSVAEQIGFSEVLSETTVFQQIYSLDAYIENLLTHSSLIRVVDRGTEPIEAARDWLHTELATFFSGGQAEFAHDASIHVLRRKSGSPADQAPPAGQ